MAPSPLTPISEESLPNFAEIKVRRENTNSAAPNSNNLNNTTPSSAKQVPEDRGCLFFYDSPEEKGPFFDDSFFKDAQRNYEEAVQNILSRNHSVLINSGDSNMSTYRNLRQENARQETQASGLTEHDDKYQIVLDVHSYAPTDITVKAVGDQELLVEGLHVERRADGSALNQKSFSRRFFLPGLVKLDAVTSALSSDGVLTVTAPKMAEQIGGGVSDKTGLGMGPSPAQEQMVNDVRSSKFNEKENRYNEELGQFINDSDLESRMKHQLGFDNKKKNSTESSSGGKPKQMGDIVEEDQHYKIALDTSGYSPNDISVKAVGERELLVEGKRVQKNESGGETSQSFSRRFCLPGPVQLQAVTSSLSLEGTLTIRAPKMAPQITSSTNNHTLNQGRRTNQQQNVPCNRTTKATETVSSNLSNAQDNKENDSPFYGDSIDDFFSKDFVVGSNNLNTFRNSNSFMEKAHNDYQESLKNMMNRNWILETESPSFFTDPSTVRVLDNSNSPQAASDIIESAEDYKMKLNVSQYRPEDISVKAVGDRELQIEGRHVEKNASGPSISNSFSRRFSLPGPVRMETVRSSLSPEGILTVTAPKMAVTAQ